MAPYTRSMLDLKSLPKVLLHEHLDGGLRPATLVELAAAAGHDLPVQTPEEVERWIHQEGSPSLAHYLEAFRHTVAVMQTTDAIARVTTEAIEDLAGDGVVYAEIRFGPLLLTEGGLDGDTVVSTALEAARRASAATGLEVRFILDALRQFDRSQEVAELAIRHQGDGVVGFDLAGPEAGNPIDAHASAIRRAADAGLHITLHAGEGDGVDSIAAALNLGAERLGHGVRIIEDTTISGGEIVELGPIAGDVHRRRIPLEVSITSNVDTGVAPSAAAHPVGMLHRAGFAVTLNTDNRLMSRTSPTREFEVAEKHHGFDLADFATVTHNALAAAFCDQDTRNRLAQGVLADAYG